jgi:hypothetical protein
MANIDTLAKRVATLEQTRAAQRAATTGVALDTLRMDELMALIHGLVPVQDGERVRQILRGDLHTVSRRPTREQDITEADLARLERCRCIGKDYAYHCFTGKLRPHYKEQIDNGHSVLECEDTAACGRSRTVERQRLLATGAYVEPEADPYA